MKKFFEVYPRSRIDSAEGAANAKATKAMHLLRLLIDELCSEDFSIDDVRLLNGSSSMRTDEGSSIHRFGPSHISTLIGLGLVEEISPNSKIYRITDRAMAIDSCDRYHEGHFPTMKDVMIESSIRESIA